MNVEMNACRKEHTIEKAEGVIPPAFYFVLIKRNTCTVLPLSESRTGIHKKSLRTAAAMLQQGCDQRFSAQRLFSQVSASDKGAVSSAGLQTS